MALAQDLCDCKVKLQMETYVQPEVHPQPSNFGQYTNKMHFMSTNVLIELCGKTFAKDFLKPVDSELLGAPEYYAIVGQPMDIGTIIKRLNNKFYHHVGEVVSDFMLIIHNCFMYNRSGSVIFERGQLLEDYFMKQLKAIPKGVEYPYDDDRKMLRSTMSVPAPSVASTRSPVKTRQMLQPPTGKENPPPTCVQPEVGPEPMNLGKYTNKLDFFKKSVLDEACKLDFCAEFMRPVDTVVLGVPKYYEVVMKPMDIGTIINRVENNFYHHVGDAMSDFMLIIYNCFKYNKPGDEVYSHGMLLDAFFKKKMQAMPTGPEITIDNAFPGAISTDCYPEIV
ncbi:homeotic protein female sterile [Drosophila persimilis]|uniref:homeotic protein female sterile n=1 Tax=Drosophila persimilis TaxID=7234 RepID=UPI000F080F73|nr:homeotic protein female sterile [Drosophila persimilis]